MYRYKGDKEIRFKITDQEDEILQEIAYQFYKRGIIKKPNIQALGRWSIIEQTLNGNRDFAIQAKIAQYVSFARQYGLDIKKFLQSIVVSRMFTIYQLANTIIYELPKLIIQHLQQPQQQQQQQHFQPKVIVISDLLGMFVNDPHIKAEEAKNLLKEIMSSVIAMRRRREMLGSSLIVISLPYHHNQQQSLRVYNKILLPRFDKRIEVFNSADNPNIDNESQEEGGGEGGVTTNKQNNGNFNPNDDDEPTIYWDLD